MKTYPPDPVRAMFSLRAARIVAPWGMGAVVLLSMAAAGHAQGPAVVSPAAGGQPTEQRWVVAAIVKDCADLATFAAAPEHWSELPGNAVDLREKAGVAAGEDYTVSMKLPGGGEPVAGELKITETAWSPNLYAPFLRDLAKHLKIAPPKDQKEAMPDADLLKALTAPLTAELEAQNQKLSAWLQAHPLDAQAHEQAALLLGTLAMRENSGLLWNPRGLCNRAAAHLAFARALRTEPGECGEVAELLVGLIIDTKADCQRRIAALQARVSAHPELGPWITAAALRNTRDYRLLAQPEHATLLERLELLRALSESTFAAEAAKRVKDLAPTTAPDWTRIMLQGDYGVDTGHAYAVPSTRLEFNNLTQVFPELAKTTAPKQIAAVLNLTPGDAVQADADGHARVHVIDQGTWAQYFQRHLLHAADETYYFLQHKYGVPEEARAFRTAAGPLLRELTLYPLCLSDLGKEDGDALFAAAAALLNQHPSWVSDRAWDAVVKTVPASYARGGDWAAVSQAWFSPRLPTGTVYGFDFRTRDGGVLPPTSRAEVESAYGIAPLKFSVCQRYADALAPGGRPTEAFYRKTVGPLLAYYLPAMKEEASLVANDPVRYGEIMTRAGAVSPNYFLTLGRYDVEHKLEPQAAEAYQAAIDHGADAVSVSSQSGWLVNYYYDHGQQDRAMAVAREAADVYSERGLETMGGLLERMGRTKEAESYYEKIKERYDDPKPLQLFHVRAASKPPGSSEGAETTEARVFPEGMATVTLAQLTDKPTRGVLIRDENALTRQVGLKPGAIVVAVDGKRVNNTDQYAYVRELGNSPEMDFLVYQDGRYQAIHVKAPGRSLRVVITDWPEQD